MNTVLSSAPTRREFLSAAAAAGLLGACATTSVQPATVPRPNIVVILADDMGIGDVQALHPDGKIPTPHLDRLVSQGCSFTDAHSGAAVCTPTRYGLLTGRYAWRSPLQRWVLDRYELPLIPRGRLTMPGMLQQQGYATACIGKWHLGWDWPGIGAGPELRPDFTEPILEGPTTRGFDYYFGTDVPNFPPYTFIENDRVTEQPTSWYASNPEVLLGMRSGPSVPGWQFEQILPTLASKAAQYVHAQAKTGKPFFLYVPLTSPHEPISPSRAFQGKSGISPLADFIMETDWAAGQVIEAVDQAGVADNTIVIFSTDNGPARYTGIEELVAAGHRASGPYRGAKTEIYEGGHRVPFVVRWPGVVAPHSTCAALVCLNDLMATFADLTGYALPENAAEDSVSLLPLFHDPAAPPVRDSLIHHGNRASFGIRRGPWKLLILLQPDDEVRFELYHLENDPGETIDLSGSHPGMVTELRALLEAQISQGRTTPGPPQRNSNPQINPYQFPEMRYVW